MMTKTLSPIMQYTELLGAHKDILRDYSLTPAQRLDAVPGARNMFNEFSAQDPKFSARAHGVEKLLTAKSVPMGSKFAYL